jgi:hypothetical protein
MKKITLVLIVTLLLGGGSAFGQQEQGQEADQSSSEVSMPEDTFKTLNISEQEVSTESALSSEAPAPASDNYLKFLLGAILLTVGAILGYLLSMLVSRKEIKKLRSEIGKKDKEITNLQELQEQNPTNRPTEVPVVVTTSEPRHPALPDFEKLVVQLEKAIKEIETSIQNADQESRITQNIKRSLEGLSVKFPGLQPTIAGWREAQQNEQLNFDRIYGDLNGGEVRKALASLYALSAYPKLGDIASYYNEKGIKHEMLSRATIDLFSGLKRKAKVDFTLPGFGTSFDSDKYDLIDKNYGPIHDMDEFSLTKILDDSLKNKKDRPIIDVRELGLPYPPTNTTITFNYPLKTTVGYYSK